MPRFLLQSAKVKALEVNERDHDFVFDWFGRGSLLEQAVQHIMNAEQGQCMTPAWFAEQSVRLSELIEHTLDNIASHIHHGERFKFMARHEELGSHESLRRRHNFIQIVKIAWNGVAERYDEELCMEWEN